MTDECNDLNRLQRETIRQLAVETARLQNRSASDLASNRLGAGLHPAGRGYRRGV